MKLLPALAIACLAGCASTGDVSKLSDRVGDLEERQIASEKALNAALQKMEQIERDVRQQNYVMNDLRKKVETLSPSAGGKAVPPDWDTQPMDPQMAAYLKGFSDLKPQDALDGSAAFEAKTLLPHLVIFVRDVQGKAHENAMLVLKRAKVSEAAPVLEPYLSDGSVRGGLLEVYAAYDPCDAVRQALLKHAKEGTESWQVMIAEALARAECRDGIRTLIQFLYSGDSTIKIMAIDALKKTTGFDLGYKPYAPKEDCRAAAEKWEAWWKENEAKFEFPRR